MTDVATLSDELAATRAELLAEQGTDANDDATRIEKIRDIAG